MNVAKFNYFSLKVYLPCLTFAPLSVIKIIVYIHVNDENILCAVSVTYPLVIILLLLVK